LIHDACPDGSLLKALSPGTKLASEAGIHCWEGIMMWMLLGLGSVLYAGTSADVSRTDSVAMSQLRSRLPADLKSKVDQARTELQARGDTLSRLSAQDREIWLENLRREAKSRRTNALENLSPQERERVEARLRKLERDVQNLPAAKPSNPGFRQ
jgi:hypothetical protein